MSPTTLYHHQESMAQLYKKLHAQDDDDDMAWLAQFSPEEKPNTICIPVPSPHLFSVIHLYIFSVNRAVTGPDSESEVEPLNLGLNFDHPNM
ncbi:hypothetical protein SCLCIDRAFT_24329 [Scleroderma citrinum Foug A]|uniref:Uncharacterized protein n=1 Tax=Scleroderma citrinum Foug A TaxID=1036808 RepID=A0A0C3E5Y7_9AGAM|nr:hypothetical protein SCLCIDRAFT_24329 [Scleroderma citrinum Foug A]